MKNCWHFQEIFFSRSIWPKRPYNVSFVLRYLHEVYSNHDPGGGGGLGEATMRFNVYIGINSGKSLKII